jgi:hypothetical protein
MVIFSKKKFERMKVWKHKANISLLVRTTILCKYILSLSNDLHNLSDNTHVRIKIYREYFHSIVYRANEGRHIRIKHPTRLMSGLK